MIGTSFNRVNTYSSNLVPFNTETTILSYLVPTGHNFNIREVKVWGDYYCEVLIKINGIQIGGTRIQCTERDRTIDYTEEPIPVRSAQLVTISIIHDGHGSINFHSNLLGELD